MKKKPALITSVCIGIVLFIWLLFADHVIGHLVDESLPKVSAFSKFESEGPAVGCVDSIAYSGGLLGMIELNGWVFVEAAEENPDRAVSLILEGQSGNKCYEMPLGEEGSQDSRPDVRNAHSLASPNVGILSRVPTYNIADGAYNMYIYCWENESSHGLMQLDMKFIKEKGTVSFDPWVSDLVNLDSRPKNDGTARFCIDSLLIEDGSLLVIGWAFQENLNCGKQSVYLDVNGTAYTTMCKSRPDVAKAYGNDDYTMSGFRADIPLKDIPEGEIKIQIIIENGAELYSSAPVAAVRRGNEIQSGRRD